MGNIMGLYPNCQMTSFFMKEITLGLRFSTLYAHDVLYYFKKDKVTYTEKAVNMQPL